MYMQGDSQNNEEISAESLWKEYQLSNSQLMKDKLVTFYIPFAKSVAAREYRRRVSEDVDYEDYEQLGMVGLIESIERYDYSKGIDFKGYALLRIKGSILNGLGRYSERRNQAILKSRLKNERLRSISDGLNGQNLFEDMIDIVIGLALGHLIESSLEKGKVENIDDSGPYKQQAFTELKSMIGAIIKKLSEQERAVINFHYYHQSSFEIIADILQVSRSRVSQIHRSAIINLREYIRSDDKYSSVI